jgi:glucan-binding YG repeat protein
MDKSNRRFFGTYFRVGYFCRGPFLPAGIRNKVFVTREASLTKLGELSHRLKDQYERYCKESGVEEVVILTDSKEYTDADISKLHARKVYIQLNFVEPSDVQYDATTRENKTEFEKNTRIKDFVFETPFTDAGKARGGIATQRLRRTTVKVSADSVLSQMPRCLHTRWWSNHT